MPLRKPGGEFWSSIRQQDERKQKMDAIKIEIKKCDEQLEELQKHEDAWAELEKDKRERLAKPEEFKDIVAPSAPTVSQDEINTKKE